MKSLIAQLIPKSRAEWINLATAFLGVVLILLSVFNNCPEEKVLQKKFFAALGDIGIGIFPTGIIGLLLERMQAREKNDQKQRIRSAVLQNLNVSIHSYFNALCNSAIADYPELKGHRVFDIFKSMKELGIPLKYDNAEKQALKALVLRIKASFESPDPTYIIADIFSQSEEQYYLLLIDNGNKLLSYLDQGGNNPAERLKFLSYLQIACEEMPEWVKFKNMVSDGNNILIPNVNPPRALKKRR